MKEYQVYIRIIIDTEVTVSADDEEQAQELAENYDVDKIIDNNIMCFDPRIEVHDILEN